MLFFKIFIIFTCNSCGPCLIISAATVSVLVFVCTDFLKICEFRKFLSQFAKSNTSGISHNSQFAKISTRKKNQIFKNKLRKERKTKSKD